MMVEYIIEIRVDFDNTDKNQVLIEAARVAAKHLFTTAVLLSDKRKPQIVLRSGDFFEGTKEIELADELPAE